MIQTLAGLKIDWDPIVEAQGKITTILKNL